MQIECLDLSALTRHGIEKDALCQNLLENFGRCGFVKVVNHRIPDAEIEQLAREGIIGTEMLMEEQLTKEKKRAAG